MGWSARSTHSLWALCRYQKRSCSPCPKPVHNKVGAAWGVKAVYTPPETQSVPRSNRLAREVETILLLLIKICILIFPTKCIMPYSFLRGLLLVFSVLVTWKLNGLKTCVNQWYYMPAFDATGMTNSSRYVSICPSVFSCLTLWALANDWWSMSLKFQNWHQPFQFGLTECIAKPIFWSGNESPSRFEDNYRCAIFPDNYKSTGLLVFPCMTICTYYTAVTVNLVGIRVGGDRIETVYVPIVGVWVIGGTEVTSWTGRGIRVQILAYEIVPVDPWVPKNLTVSDGIGTSRVRLCWTWVCASHISDFGRVDVRWKDAGSPSWCDFVVIWRIWRIWKDVCGSLFEWDCDGLV